MKAIEEGIITSTTKARMNELENALMEINMKIAAEECKLERKLTKEDVEAHIMDALASDPRTLIEYLIERIVLYEDKIHIFYKHTKQNTNPDEPRAEVHRDFSLYGQEIKITQSGFSTIFEIEI